MWRKRGRPKNTDINIDKGTIELQRKRKDNLTIESLDLYLQKNIITPIEHMSGIKLRWIYTLRFGVPTIQSKLLQMKFYDSKSYDEKFLQNLQKKYADIIEILKKVHAHKIVMNVCIFNEFPNFLRWRKPSNHQEEKFVQGIKRWRVELLFVQ